MTVTMEAPVPVFDDEAEGRKLAIICSKGSLDMAYPGLVLANAALGEGIETHLSSSRFGGLTSSTTRRWGTCNSRRSATRRRTCRRCSWACLE